MTRRSLTAILVAAASMLPIVTATRAGAADPPDGSLSAKTTFVVWTGPVLTGEARPEDCATDVDVEVGVDPCDRFVLTIDLDPSFWGDHSGLLDVGIRWQHAEDDFDLYVLDEAGDPVGSPVTAVTQDGTTEELSIPEPVGTFVIRVLPASVMEADYVGWAFLSSAEDPPAEEPDHNGGGGTHNGSGNGSPAGEPDERPGPAAAASPTTDGVSFQAPPFGSHSFDSTGSPDTDEGAPFAPPGSSPAPPTVAPAIPSASPTPVHVAPANTRRPVRIPDGVWVVLALALAGFTLTVVAVSEPASGATPATPARSARPRTGPTFRLTTFDRRFVLSWG